MTGKQLQLMRVAMDVSQGALAERLGHASPSSVSKWESARQVPDKASRRYLAALATFGTIPTVEVTTPAEGASA